MVLLAVLAIGTASAPYTAGDSAFAPPVVTGTAEIASPTSDEPLEIVGGDRAPVPRHQLKPVYPPEARYAGITGTVVLSIIVDVDGHVESLELLESQPPFDEAAVRAVKHWEYEPFLVDGKPVRWKSKVTLHFKLRDWTPDDRRPVGGTPGYDSDLRWVRYVRPPPRFGERGVTEFGPSFGLGTARTRGSRAPGEPAPSTISFLHLFAGRFFARGLETSLGGRSASRTTFCWPSVPRASHVRRKRPSA